MYYINSYVTPEKRRKTKKTTVLLNLMQVTLQKVTAQNWRVKGAVKLIVFHQCKYFTKVRKIFRSIVSYYQVRDNIHLR